MSKDNNRTTLLYSIVFAQQELIQSLYEFISLIDNSDGAHAHFKMENGSVVVKDLSEIRRDQCDENFDAMVEIEKLFSKLDELDAKEQRQ